MKERPILLKDEMVRAILEGRKTQTRRALNPQPLDEYGRLLGPELYSPTVVDRFGCEQPGDEVFGAYTEDGDFGIKCPYGQPGDRLWVREAWRVGAWHGPAHSRSIDHWVAVDYAAGDHARQECLECPKDMRQRLVDQSISDANKSGITPAEDGAYSWNVGESPCRWRPSIHMPRWASRITLEITDVRVERLQDISEADTEREGFSGGRGHFTDTWIGIYGRDSLDANPWVWVIEFRRVKP